jgi:thiol-disulfide isomerase/thioredoxin
MTAVSQIALAFDVVLFVAVVVNSAMLLGVLYLLAIIRRRLGPDPGPLVPADGLPIGHEAPPLSAPEARTGRMVHLTDFRGREAVVAFLSPTCTPCVDLADHLNHLANVRRDVAVIIVVAAGEGFDYAAGLGKRVLVIADRAGDMQVVYEVKRMPLVYVVDARGYVAIRVVPRDLTDLEDMLDRIAVAQGNRPWMPVETPPRRVEPE